MDTVNIKIEDYMEKKYQIVKPFYDGLALVQNKERLYGYIDEYGFEKIPCQFRNAESFHDGLALTYEQIGGPYQFIDKEGTVQLVCSSKYQTVGPFYNDRALVCDRNFRFGYIDKNGLEVIPCQFYDAFHFSEDLALVDLRAFYNKGIFKICCADTKWVFIDKEGRILSSLRGDFCGFYFHQGVVPFLFSKNGTKKLQKGYMNKKGQVYVQKKDVERLDGYYNFHEPRRTLNQKYISSHCSKITFLDHTILLKADSKLELIEKKEKLMKHIKRTICEFGIRELQIETEDFKQKRK